MLNTRILVTGGTGLLGSYLLRSFKARGYTNLTATCQNPDGPIPEDLKEGIQWQRLRLPDIQDAYEAVRDKDWVIHSAALVSYFKEEKYKLLDVNQRGTEHIVNACIAHGVQHLIYIGSIGALGKETNHVTLNESSPWLQTQYSTSYGLSKYLGELEVWRGAGEGLNVSVILPSVILGTGDWQRSSLQILDRVANHPPFYPGGQTGYIDVRDIVKFATLLLERSLSGERWLLTNTNMTYQQLYTRIANGLDIKRNFREAPQWLARIILLASNIKSGRFSMPEVLPQVYASFYYDHAKSLTLEGFQYRPMEETIREVTQAYKEGKGHLPLDPYP